MNRSQLDALLVLCPPWDVSRPPIGLAYLAAALRSRGFSVAALDLGIRFHNAVAGTPLQQYWDVNSVNLTTAAEVARALWEGAGDLVDRTVEEILATGARYLGFSIQMRNVGFTERLVARIRARDPDRVVIYGGPEVTLAQRSGTLAALGADAFVIGEGEKTLGDIIATHRKKNRFEPTPGMVYRENGRLSHFTPRPFIADLDSLPFPTYEDFDVREYWPDGRRANLPFLFSRGCVFKCAFCMDHLITGAHRTRSAAHCVAEFKHQARRHDIRLFWFTDLMCNGDPRALERLCEGIVGESLKIRWWSYAAIHGGLTPDLLAKMKTAGCLSLNFGLESGSDRVLKLMNKRYNAATAEGVLRRCARAGIRADINIIVGFPGETREDHRATLRFLLRNRDYIHRVTNLNSLNITPHSAVGRNLARYGVSVDARSGVWSRADGNDLAERRRRMAEVARLCQDANIELGNVLGEFGESEASMKQPIARPQTASKIAITDVKLLDKFDHECARYETHDAITVAIRFRVGDPIEDPLFRVQIFNNQTEGGDDILMFGMNTNRLHVPVGALAAGDGEIRLHVYRLELLPGTYRVTVAVLADEFADEALDIRDKEYEFKVDGLSGPSNARVALPLSWVVGEDLGGRPAEGTFIENLTIQKDDGEKVELATNEPLIVRAAVNLGEAKLMRMTVAILLDRYLVHMAGLAFVATPGRRALEFRYNPVSLLEGTFTFEASFDDAAPCGLPEKHQIDLQVRSLRRQGAGLVFMPCAWDVVNLPRRSFATDRSVGI